MPTVGPQLPPSLLEKRKRTDEDDESDRESESSKSSVEPDASPGSTSKRQRVLGPSLPPAPLEERPQSSPHESADEDGSSSDDDDDFGPSLPTVTNSKSSTSVPAQPSSNPSKPPPAKRDDWMMTPPSHGDWSARVDPTKLKNRKFNTGKGAKGPSQNGGASDTWHETPEQKQARLQREIMGVKDESSGSSAAASRSREDPQDTATARRLEEYKKSRGPALYDAYQKSKDREQEDDPSARAFDREKDIAGGLQINSTQRREMMKKASDFNSRFSSAKYL